MADSSMKKKLIVIIAAIVVVAGVATIVLSHRSSRPDQKKMVNALSDVYLLEAALQQKGNLTQFNAKSIEQCYHTLLAHYGMTKAEFDSTMSWYSYHPKEYSELNHSVIARLSSRENEFLTAFNKRDSLSNVIRVVSDSIKRQFWHWPTVVRLPLADKDTIDRSLHFDAEFDSLRGGKIYARMAHVFPFRNPMKDSCQMRLTVAYNDTTIDTMEVSIKKKVVQQRAEIAYPVCDTLWARSAQLTLLTSPRKDLDKTVATLSEITFYYMPFEVTDSINIDEVVLPSLFPF